MLLQQRLIILRVDHVARRDDDVREREPLDDGQVLHKRRDVGVVDIAGGVRLREQNLNVAALRVDVVAARAADVFGQGTRVLADIDQNAVDVAVAHIGNRKINDAVAAGEGERADRAVCLKPLYMHVICG